MPFAPDLAVEVASPARGTDVMAAKARIYLRGGTRLVWRLFGAVALLPGVPQFAAQPRDLAFSALPRFLGATPAPLGLLLGGQQDPIRRLRLEQRSLRRQVQSEHLAPEPALLVRTPGLESASCPPPPPTRQRRGAAFTGRE